MHKKLIIIGASGHGKVVADIASKMNKYYEIEFLDDNQAMKSCIGFPVVGTSRDFLKYLQQADFFVAIGNTKIRKKIMEQITEHGASIATLIHPMASISNYVSIGEGSVIMSGAVINPDPTIGKGCIVNTGATVDHDCRIGDYVHVAVGAHVCGTVTIGNSTWIGAGATVKNNISICDEWTVGISAAVVKDIVHPGTYIGVPAVRLLLE